MQSWPIEGRQGQLQKQAPTPAGATDHWSPGNPKGGYRFEHRGHQPLQRLRTSKGGGPSRTHANRSAPLRDCRGGWSDSQGLGHRNLAPNCGLAVGFPAVLSLSPRGGAPLLRVAQPRWRCRLAGTWLCTLQLGSTSERVHQEASLCLDNPSFSDPAWGDADSKLQATGNSSIAQLS